MKDLTRKERLEIYKDIQLTLRHVRGYGENWCYSGFCDYLKERGVYIKQLPELLEKGSVNVWPNHAYTERVHWFPKHLVTPRLKLINEVIEEMEACDTVRTELMDNLRKVGFSTSEAAEAMRECWKLTDPGYRRKKGMAWLKENFTEPECELENLIDNTTKTSLMTREDIMNGLEYIRKGKIEKESLFNCLLYLKEMSNNGIKGTEAGRRIMRVLEKIGKATKDPKESYIIRVEKEGQESYEEIYTQRVDFNPTVNIQEMLNK